VPLVAASERGEAQTQGGGNGARANTPWVL